MMRALRKKQASAFNITNATGSEAESMGVALHGIQSWRRPANIYTKQKSKIKGAILMQPANVNYVYLETGPHSRRPRVGSTNPFVQFSGGFAGNYQDTFSIYGAQLNPIEVVEGTTYYFAFVSISDGMNSLTSTAAGQDTPPFPVGSAPINALVVYVPAGANGNGTGATIDAWDETSLLLVNDIFVSVTPDDSTNDLTNDGNIEGFVPTTSDSPETISASSPIEPANATFVQWINLLQNVPGSANQSFPSVGVQQLVAAPDSNYFAWAVYKSIPYRIPTVIRGFGGPIPTVIILTPGGGSIRLPGIGGGIITVNGSGEDRDGLAPGETSTISQTGKLTTTKPDS